MPCVGTRPSSLDPAIGCPRSADQRIGSAAQPARRPFSAPTSREAKPDASPGDEAGSGDRSGETTDASPEARARQSIDTFTPSIAAWNCARFEATMPSRFSVATTVITAT